MRRFTYDYMFKDGNDVCITKSNCAWIEPLHTHEFMEFVYVARGGGWHEINGVRYDVHKGSFLLINFGQEHELAVVDGTIYYNIIFKPEFFFGGGSSFINDNAFEILTLSSFEDFKELISEKSMIQFQGMDILQADMLAERLHEEYQKNIPGSKTMIRCCAMMLITMAFREMTQSFSKNIKKHITADVLNYIESHYNEKLSVAELAKKSLYQPAYFSTIFKECYGMTITQFIQNKRVEQACWYLENTELSVDEIGKRIGYDDDVRFYRYFKKVCGVSPNSYRKIKNKK